MVKRSRKIAGRLLASLAASFVVLSLTARAADWPQWRGPDGSGVSSERGLPEEWGETKNVKWKTPIPGARTPARSSGASASS